MVLNELALGYFRFRSILGSIVLDEVSINLGMLRGILLEGLLMVLAAMLCAVVVCAAWSSISLVAFDGLRPQLTRFRGASLLFWFLSVFTFFHSWYSAHRLLVPGSILSESALFLLTRPIRLPLGDESIQLRNTVAAILVMLALTSYALWRSSRLRRSLAVGLVLFTAVTWTYGRLTGIGRITRFTAPGSVVILGIDSLQMNRLVVGGAREDISPAINEFLESSARFDNCWTPHSRTYPSWLSILTGRYPVHHGVRFNLMADENLATDNEYLPELLQKRGYTTFHGTDESRFSVIRSRFGFDEVLHPRMGLSDFVTTSFFDFSAVNLFRETHLGHDLFPAVANNRASPAYKPRLFVQNLLKRINRLPADEPLFVAVHLVGNHFPFSTTAPYSWSGRGWVEQSIMMVDDQMAEILDYLDESGLREHAIVIMLSDHGDGFLGQEDDPANDHGSNFDRPQSSKVILGVQGPGIERRVVKELVRTIDIHPTVLELVRSSPSRNVDGVSLLAALHGEPISSRSLFAETGMSINTIDSKRLVKEKAMWYSMDPESGLFFLRRNAAEELMSLKGYMFIGTAHRLVVEPHRRRFDLYPFDPDTGLDRSSVARLSDPERLDMLREMARHFDLDFEELAAMSLDRGFVESLTPASD